jgi:Na+-driven multidrug efflux pump
VIQIFNRDPELVQNASAALPLFALSFIPMALNLIYTAFLYSTKRTLQADAISLSRGVVLKATAIFCIPVLLGIDVIWLAPFAAELLTLVLALALTRGCKLVEC